MPSAGFVTAKGELDVKPRLISPEVLEEQRPT
jgi:hypothetical protein